MDFVQAKNYTRTSGRQIDLIVIHDMEAEEHGRTAENVARYFATTNVKASAHYNIDNNSVVQSVRDQDVAWHAPGANHDGIGLEHAGYARQTRDEWLDDYGIAMLRDQSAPLARRLCEKYSIPVEFVDAAGLRAGKRGITTHLMVRDAWGRTTHWDPGYHFPMDQYLAWIKGSDGLVVPAPEPGKIPVATTSNLLREGSWNEDVKDWQNILRGAGHKIAADGIFGPATTRATKAFQKALGVSADGIVGPATREATARLLNWLVATEATKKPAPKHPTYPGTLIGKGDRGHNVSTVQQRLRDRGWRISVDGIFGSGTDKVVRAFQKEKGLAVDGLVGRKTWDALWTAPVT